MLYIALIGLIMDYFDQGYLHFKKQEYDRAIHCFRCGTGLYSVNPGCASYLAYCHEVGYGTHKDPYTALVWYRMAMEAGGRKYERSWVDRRMRALEAMKPERHPVPDGLHDCVFGYVRFAYDPKKYVSVNFTDGYIKVSGNFPREPYDRVMARVAAAVEHKESCREAYGREGLPKVIDEAFTCDYEHFKLRIRRGSGRKFTHHIEGDHYVIDAPADVVFEHAAVRETILNYIRRLVRDAARKYLPERLEQLSRQTGLPYNKCRVCALSGALGLYYIKSRNIDLEYSLILHRQDRLDAVLVHELCHNISPGHDRKFYDALLKYGGERLYRADTRGDSDTFPIY
jgi:hypothetical protein